MTSTLSDRRTGAAWCMLIAAMGPACSDSGDGDAATTGDVPWTTTAVGATASAGSGGATGAGGSGGTTTTGTTTTGAGGAGGAGAGGGGPALAVALAVGPSGSLTATFDGAAWTSSTASEGSDRAPAIGYVGAATAVGVVRSSSAPHRLRFVEWSSGMGFEAFADVAATATTRDRPAFGDGALVYQGTDFKHYYGAFVSGWTPSAEPIGPSVPLQSFGPAAGSVASIGNDVVFAFGGDDGGVYVQTRSNGSWAAADPIAGAGTVLSPSIVALSNGPELLAVWVNDDPGQVDDTKIFYATRTSGQWSIPGKIDDTVFAGEAPSLAAVAGGGAVLAFRGTDDKPYTLRFDNGAWGGVIPVASPNPTIASPPAVSSGASGADAELVYVSGGSAMHVRLSGNSWSSPLTIGGNGLTHAAMAVP